MLGLHSLAAVLLGFSRQMHACSACIVHKASTHNFLLAAQDFGYKDGMVTPYDTSQLLHTGQALLPVHACIFVPKIAAICLAAAGTVLTLMSFSSGA